MNLEREKESQKHKDEYNKRQKQLIEKEQKLEKVKFDLYSLFSLSDRQKRGNLLEDVLNRLFKIYGILVRESFRLIDKDSGGVEEQIDGIIEIDGAVYLVEIKWTKDPTDVVDVSRHLVRVYHRGCARAIFISSSGYTKAAIKVCEEALQKTVITLCTLKELVTLLDNKNNLKEFLNRKINAAIAEKKPFLPITDNGNGNC